MLQLHKILFGIVFIGLMAAGVAIFIANGVTIYTPTDYNSSDLESFNQLSNISDNLDSYTKNGTEIGEDQQNDILGGIFSSAYRNIKIVRGSTEVFSTLLDKGIEKTPLIGSYGGVLKLGIGLLLIIAIFIGVFAHFLIKSDRL